MTVIWNKKFTFNLLLNYRNIQMRTLTSTMAKNCREQDFLIGTTNLEKVGKMNLMIGDEIM